MAGEILQYLKDRSFAADATRAMDEAYDKGGTSPLRVTVERGKTNHFEWTLKPPKK